MNKKPLFLIAAFIFALISCKQHDKHKKGDPVARIYEKYLYKTDITGLVPNGTSPQDSVQIVRNFINNWIQKQIIINKAQSNLPPEKQNFDEQLEEYKNSLLIYQYEKELVRQTLDTVVSDEEITTYYNAHQSDFELKDNIMQVVYVKLPKNSSVVSQIRMLYKSDNPEQKQKLTELCQGYAANFMLDDSTWLFFNDLLKEIPIKTYNQEQYLQNHRYVEMSDSVFNYYLNIKGFRIKESLSPLSLELDNIKNIIINKRKIKLIQQMHKDLYKTATNNNDFEIY